jgi:hypothetical protein
MMDKRCGRSSHLFIDAHAPSLHATVVNGETSADCSLVNSESSRYTKAARLYKGQNANIAQNAPP